MHYRAHVTIPDTCVEKTVRVTRNLYARLARARKRGPRPKLGAVTLAHITLVHLKTGQLLPDLAPAYGVSANTLYSWVTRVVKLLESDRVKLHDITGDGEVYMVLDGTLVRTDRIKAKLPGLNSDLFYSGKHKAFGVNMQGLMGADGVMLWLGPATPGSTHDMRAAREQGILEHLKHLSVETLADSGYQRSPRIDRWSGQDPLQGTP